VNEFRVAQANLRANIAAGRGRTFAHRRSGRHLPTIFAYFHGTNGSANNAASYTSANFTNNTFLTPLATHNPNPIGFADSLYGDAGRRTNAANAGIPANFFLANPDLQGGADLTTNVGSNYHGPARSQRRQGLQFQTSYAYGRTMLRVPVVHKSTCGDAGSPATSRRLQATLARTPFARAGALAAGERGRRSTIGGRTFGLSSASRAAAVNLATSGGRECRPPTCRTSQAPVRRCECLVHMLPQKSPMR
jgi:hypothetical protein